MDANGGALLKPRGDPIINLALQQGAPVQNLNADGARDRLINMGATEADFDTLVRLVTSPIYRTLSD